MTGTRIRKVLLVYPQPRRYSGYLSTHRMPGMVTSHAGLTILAQILARRGLQVRVVDEKISPVRDRDLDGVDLLGVSIQTSWAPRGYALAARARELGIPVVLGGVHATLAHQEAIAHADYVVRGEGEHALPELIEALDAGTGLAGIAGLSWHDGGHVRDNPDRPPMDSAALDRVPWPRLDLIEGWDSARHPISRRIHFTMLTRGCDQACTFCSITRVFGQALRRRGVGNIIEELGSRFDPARQFLFLMDDSLAVDPDFLKEFLEALVREKLVPRLGWHSQMRADVARDPELLRLMQATNCMFVTCGFESIDSASLKRLGKGQSPDDVRAAIHKLRDAGIIVNGFFMFGTDEDGPETFAATVDFARRSGCMMAGFMPLTPFPGTPMYTKLEREGRIFTRDWELYDVQHVVFRPAKMTASELYWRTLRCYPRFYRTDFWRRNLGHTRTRAATPFGAVLGALWPVVKGYTWSREVLANLDYAAMLRQVDAEGSPIARPRGQRLPVIA